MDNRLGDYYLYFAHHKGGHIRMAYADLPTGPWTLYEPGVVSLEDSGFPGELPCAPRKGGFEALWATFSIHVVRDYLLLAYRATVAAPAIRSERGLDPAANVKPHIASPEVIVDEVTRWSTSGE